MGPSCLHSHFLFSTLLSISPFTSLPPPPSPASPQISFGVPFLPFHPFLFLSHNPPNPHRPPTQFWGATFPFSPLSHPLPTFSHIPPFLRPSLCSFGGSPPPTHFADLTRPFPLLPPFPIASWPTPPPPQLLPLAPWPAPGRCRQPQSSHAALGAPVRTSAGSAALPALIG